MKQWLALGGIVFWGVVVLGGCSGKTEDGRSAVAPLPQSSFGEASARALCDSFSRCCGNAALPFDAAGCQSNLQSELQASLDVELAQGATYDAEAAGECLEALKAATKCGERDAFRSIPVCQRVLITTAANGQDCRFNAECTSGYCQLGSVGCADRPSSEPVFVAAKSGEGCARDCEDIASCPPPELGNVLPVVVCLRSDGLRCSDTCQPLGTAGDDCLVNQDCEDGLFCGPLNDPTQNPHCAAPRAIGAICDQALDCQSGQCVDGLCAEVTAEQCATGRL